MSGTAVRILWGSARAMKSVNLGQFALRSCLRVDRGYRAVVSKTSRIAELARRLKAGLTGLLPRLPMPRPAPVPVRV